MMTPLMQLNKHSNQRGNAFLFILIGIVLFAGLIFTVSRSMRSQTTQQMSDRELQLAASEFLDYGQKISRAVDRARRRGCSESEISFENGVLGGYANASAPSDNSCHIFHPNGGGISFKNSTDITSLAGVTRFNANNRFYEFGCDTQSAPCSDLAIQITLNNVPELCLKINDLAKIENPSNASPRISEWNVGAAFIGTFGSPGTVLIGGPNAVSEAPQLKGKPGGCFFEYSGGQNNYIFYYVLLAR